MLQRVATSAPRLDAMQGVRSSPSTRTDGGRRGVSLTTEAVAIRGIGEQDGDRVWAASGTRAERRQGGEQDGGRAQRRRKPGRRRDAPTEEAGRGRGPPVEEAEHGAGRHGSVGGGGEVRRRAWAVAAELIHGCGPFRPVAASSCSPLLLPRGVAAMEKPSVRRTRGLLGQVESGASQTRNQMVTWGAQRDRAWPDRGGGRRPHL